MYNASSLDKRCLTPKKYAFFIQFKLWYALYNNVVLENAER